MRAVLGMDAAWTAGHPSGVALLDEDPSGWRCVALAPSYHQFVAMARGREVDWSAPIAGSPPDPAVLLVAAEMLLGHGSLAVIAADIPLATVPIEGRRAADQYISMAFGARGCGAHSPGTDRPGKVGTTIRDGFLGAGFPLTVASTPVGEARRLLEVYPHPALLSLTGAGYRLTYKVARSLSYWPGTALSVRIGGLLGTLRSILLDLKSEVRGIELGLPEGPAVQNLGALKRYEDAIDALVCAWVGVRYLMRMAQPHGDDTAAIWVPSSAPLPGAD